jgi:hypothetical protein
MVMELTKQTVFDAAILYLTGFVTNPPNEETLREGVSEHHPGKLSTGTVWVYDGRTVLDKAIEQDVVTKREGVRAPVSIPSLEDLAGLVRSTPDNDLTYFVNTEFKTATPVKGQLRNYDRGTSLWELGQQLPNDFLAYDGSVSKENVGGRTDTAMLSAKLMNSTSVNPEGSEVRVIIAKETPYANTKYGKVAEFGPHGALCKEFFLVHDPSYAGRFIDEKEKFVGVLREYEFTESGRPVKLVQESYVHFENGEVKYTPIVALQKAA